MTDALDPVVISPNASIRDAMRAIQAGGLEICLVVDEKRRLIGVITDGDLRGALLDGRGLDDSIEAEMTKSPYTATDSMGRAEVLDLMKARRIKQIPVVDSDGVVTGLHVMHEVLGAVNRPNIAVIMAGGKGRRLAPLTDDVPKPMLTVAGRPILERLVHHLVGNGITQIAIAVNYRAEVIEDHFGDGADLGCRITYLREDPERPLGTGGPLGLLARSDLVLEHPLVVMNGDLVTDFDVDGILRHHASRGAAATIAVHSYRHEVPYGVVDIDEGGFAIGLREKPVKAWPVNAGVYVLDPSLLERIPEAVEYPFTVLLDEVIEEGLPVAAWELDGHWQDVGHIDELRRARGHE